MIKAILYYRYLFALLLLFVQCDTNEPPTNSIITLKLEEVSCTEAWINLTTANLQLPATITIKQNDKTRSTISLVKLDTLLFIDSLLPNQTYKFQSVIQSINHSSNVLTVTTMDTTSHEFTFQSWTFGEHSSSVLYDVAIINENNIWGVGEIYMNDSLGQPDPKAYNTVHYDGSQWELKRVYFPTVCGQTSLIPYPAKAIFTFDDGQIWISSSGDKMAILQEGSQVNQFCLPLNVSMSINKIWGISSSDLYVIGDGGNIAQYAGNNWTQIESGTETNINDVWGIIDPVTQDKIIYCAVSYVFQTGDQKILTIKNNKVDSLSWNTGRRVHSVWTNSKNYVYTAGGGIFQNKNGYWNEITQVPLYYSRNIRGDGTNNIFVSGDYGLFAHYNGSTWKTYNELSIQGIYFSVAVKNNIVITVGLEGNKAIIVKGNRN